MRRILAMLALTVAALTAAPASAATPSCTGHVANQPYVDLVNNGQTTLAGTGGVNACASGSNVTITVTAQHQNPDGTWTTLASTGPMYHWFNPRYSKAYYLTVHFPCQVGYSRIVMAGDGVTVYGTPTRFSAGDSGTCGSYGGGDKRRTPTCITHAQLDQAQVGDTQAQVEQQDFNGYTGSLSQAPHQGDNGVWWFKTKWYDECAHLYHGGQIEYRQPTADYPTGVWHVKTATYI